MDTLPTTVNQQVNLTGKQLRFCKEYCIDWNATQAAIRAGYSKKTAKQIGYENLTKPYFQNYIEEIQKDLSKLAGISALSNLNKLKKIIDNDKEKTVDQIRAVEVVNKMQGYNAVEKKELDLNITDEQRKRAASLFPTPEQWDEQSKGM